MLEPFIFYFLVALTLGSAALVVLARTAITSAVFMILTFIGSAGLFLTLNAPFLAILQILVYAGAVMVLFVFIIMLTSSAKTTTEKISCSTVVAGALLFCTLVGFACAVAWKVPASPPLRAHSSLSIKQVGYALLTEYMLPMQVIGCLLLVAMIGVVVISKPYLKASPAAESTGTMHERLD